MCSKVRRNVVLELKSVEDGSAVFLLHLGDRKALPADFMHRYGTESFREKLCRLLKCVASRLLGAGPFSYHRCRIPVAAGTSKTDDVFAWRVEDAFHVLREAGFLLHDDNRGEWSPYDIYRYLVEQGRISTPMPVLRTTPVGYTDTTR